MNCETALPALELAPFLMSKKLRILIADDHPIFRRGLCDVIETAAGLQLVGQAGDGD